MRFQSFSTTDNETLAQGDFAQVRAGDQVTARLVFRFKDGSLYDETVVFSQRDRFTLLSYRIVQRGPSFPETARSLDGPADRAVREVRYRADEESAEEHLSGNARHSRRRLQRDALADRQEPAARRRARPSRSSPSRRSPCRDAPALAAGHGRVPAGEVVRYHVRPKLGLFASLLVTDVPDTRVWILLGEAPAFLKAEGPLYFMGPIWRVEAPLIHGCAGPADRRRSPRRSTGANQIRGAGDGNQGHRSLGHRCGRPAPHARLLPEARLRHRVGEAAGPSGHGDDPDQRRAEDQRPRTEAPARAGYLGARQPRSAAPTSVSSGTAPSTRSSPC